MSQAGGETIPGRQRVARRRELKTERDDPEQTHGLGPGYDQGAVEAGRRHRPCPGQASRLASGQTSEHAAAQPGAAGWRLVIGVDGDQVPGLSYHVQTRFTVAASTWPRQDGELTAVLPGGGQRQQAGHGVAAVSGAGAR